MLRRLLRGSKAPAPEWAPSFSDRASADRFVAAVARYFEAKGSPVVIDDGWVTLGDTPAGADAVRMGLTNLAARCAAVPEREWPAVVQEHFRAVDRAREAGSAIGGDPSFDDARDALAVRLFHRSVLDPTGRNDPRSAFVVREDLPDLPTTLVLHSGGTVRSVSRKVAGRWGMDDETLLRIGLENSRQSLSLTIDEAQGDGPNFFLIESESMVCSAAVLFLNDIEGMIGPRGSVVSVPLRDLVAVLPVGDEYRPEWGAKIADMAAGLFQQCEGPISPELYWTDGSVFVRLGCRDSRQRLLEAGLPGSVASLLTT